MSMEKKIWVLVGVMLFIIFVAHFIFWENIIDINARLLPLTSSDSSETVKTPTFDMDGLADILQAFKSRIIMFPLLITLVLCLGAVFIAYDHKRFFKNIIFEMDKLAGQIDGTSYAVRSAGSLLSNDVNRQVEAIEKTAQTHKEIMLQIQDDVHEADKAGQLVKENMQQATSANQTMQHFVISMDEIQSASENIQKIVDNIDSIANKTNLLAINASVESSRAGEAGAAFSVIADEMRNLAQSSSLSARETTELMEATVEKVRKGAQTVGQISEVFEKMMKHIDVVQTYITSSVTSATQQSEKIHYLNSAIEELEALTRSNEQNSQKTNLISETLQNDGKALRLYISDIISKTLMRGRLSQDDLKKMLLNLDRLGTQKSLGVTPETHRNRLLEWRNHFHNIIEAVYSCDASGAFIFSEPPAAIDNACIRPWWQQAVAGKQYVSPIYISAINNKPCCTISVPLYGPMGEIKGVLGADLRI